MKYPVRQFVSMKAALKELEPYVRDSGQLQSGKPFKNFGEMRPREAWANWLVCATINSTGEKDLTFTTDPIGGDGIIIDKKTNDVFPTEHVMVSRHRTEGQDTQTLVLAAIAKSKGKAVPPTLPVKRSLCFSIPELANGFPTARPRPCLSRSILPPYG
jgi:hypothetical protein